MFFVRRAQIDLLTYLLNVHVQLKQGLTEVDDDKNVCLLFSAWSKECVSRVSITLRRLLITDQYSVLMSTKYTVRLYDVQ